MTEMTTTLREELAHIVEDRVSYDLLERKIYSHDVGEIPALVRPLLGRALADAVVQPRTEAELVELVNWANKHDVPLVPRGKATSGYGGVLPVKGGLTVDLHRMRRILATDGEAMTVTVRPSVVWRDLETELGKVGLALRAYPSSAPSSTVGGWLAQGGVGFGSYEFGAFRENVVSARVVLPTGEVKTFSGDELLLVSEAEGITGIITEVTVRVRALDEELVWAARFPSAVEAAAAIQAVSDDKLPLWSVSFTNPRMSELKNLLPSKIEHGQRELTPVLPEAYIVIFAAPAARKAEVESKLTELVRAQGGAWLSDDIARHEWQDRFNLMHVKRLGPSLAPAEVVVPLKGLAGALQDLDATIRQPFVMEGMVSGGPEPEVTLLGFIPHDSKTFGYNMAFALSLSVIKIAKKHGGRAYSTGLYFAHEAERVLGADRLAKLRQFKAQVDPRGIMNPGKVLDGPAAIGTLMGLATTFEPMVRAFGNAASSPIGERPAVRGKRGIADDVAWYADACAQCGYCVDHCDQYYGRHWESQSPRGKWFFLREYMAGRVSMPQDQVDTFLACTTCEYCNVECPLGLPIESSWLKMRGGLIETEKKMTFPPFEVMGAALRKEGNIWASYRKDRDAWITPELAAGMDDGSDTAYFAGCTASYVENDIAQATSALLEKAGVKFTTLGKEENCCGIPMLVAGLWDTWESNMRHNIDAMKAKGIKTVITSCPACWLVWKVYYREWAEKLGIDYPFEARHYSEVLGEKAASGDLAFDQKVDMKLTFHDSCHMGRAGGIYEPPRQLLQSVPGVQFVEMEHNREHAHCCGSVLSLVADPDVAREVGDVRLKEAEAAGAEAVVSVCPCCQVQLRVTAQKTGRDLKVIDLSHLLCDGLGIQHKDPTEYALEQWAVFEKMILLMKPKPMADMMIELFPQMFAAMPAPMVLMMKAARNVPGMLSVMKPMMPKMMPMLMPMIMPKVMPDMLTAVGKRVPMPQHMQEQMPDLMPGVMNNLLPKMLPLVMPYIVPPMMDYIQTKL